MALMNCPECGQQISSKAGSCPYCGTPISNGNVAPKTMPHYVSLKSDKSKTVALLLCIFGGGLGLHQYYVGRIGKGLLYTFTVGIFGIGWVIDLISILLGTFKDNVGMPLRG